MDSIYYYAGKYNVPLASFTTFLGAVSGEQIFFWGGVITMIGTGIATFLGIRKEFYASESAKFDYISKKRTFNLDEFQIKDGK